MIASLGLIADSSAVIIGAMIIAPLMLPIRGVALALLDREETLLQKGLITLGVGTLLGVGISSLLGVLISPEWNKEILARTQPNLLDLGVALAAGGMGAFAKVRRGLSDTLAGVSIAVALMPPVCVIGIGLSRLDWQVSWGATLLYLTNLVGINLACILTFLLLGYGSVQKARTSVIWIFALVGLLLIPLGASFARLVAQTRLQSGLKDILLRGTVTFQRIELIQTEFNWLGDPPEVRLLVRASEPVTPTQVNLLEKYVRGRLHQDFRLIFEVSQTAVVTSHTRSGSSQPSFPALNSSPPPLLPSPKDLYPILEPTVVPNPEISPSP